MCEEGLQYDEVWVDAVIQGHPERCAVTECGRRFPIHSAISVTGGLKHDDKVKIRRPVDLDNGYALVVGWRD